MFQFDHNYYFRFRQESEYLLDKYTGAFMTTKTLFVIFREIKALWHQKMTSKSKRNLEYQLHWHLFSFIDFIKCSHIHYFEMRFFPNMFLDLYVI